MWGWELGRTNMEWNVDGAYELHHHRPVLTRWLRFCLKTWGRASNVSALLYVIFQYAPFLACRYGNTNTCCLQFELGKGKIWALRRGLVCGRHVCFVFTHTQSCQMNNAFLPPPSCSDQSCIGVTRTRFLVSFSTGSLIIGDEDGKLLSRVIIFFLHFLISSIVGAFSSRTCPSLFDALLQQC